MKTKIKILLGIGIACILFMASSCKKDKTSPETDEGLNTYTLTLENAIIQNAACGVDLANGVVYSVAEGLGRQENVDIAYGYMTKGERKERCFLAISYAGCACGGSSMFSYGDTSSPRTGYYSYSVKNETKLLPASAVIDFDKIFSTAKKADLEAALSQLSSNEHYTDEAFFSSQDNLVQPPYVFFQTVKGKRGIMRVKGYVKDVATDYHLRKNPITIDVVIEK
ncbi:hypothetical protein [Parapedobacter defluvii]|uniref:hypothetical protein n=1 Tax=Parapedobacter defluvii TaxID=2045106 RepID=UPI0033426798